MSVPVLILCSLYTFRLWIGYVLSILICPMETTHSGLSVSSKKFNLSTISAVSIRFTGLSTIAEFIHNIRFQIFGMFLTVGEHNCAKERKTVVQTT